MKMCLTSAVVPLAAPIETKGSNYPTKNNKDGCRPAVHDNGMSAPEQQPLVGVETPSSDDGLLGTASDNDIEPHENDILMGRGGKNNQHSGNEKLRELARGHCEEYQQSTKKGKSNISRILVQQVRELDPPARCVPSAKLNCDHSSCSYL